MATEAKKEISPEEALKKFNARLKKMSKDEALQTFVDAGILTKKGNVRRPYRGAIVRKAAKATS